MTKFDNMCLPAKLYLILSMISIASMFFSTYNIMNLFESLLITGVWTYLLNMLCKRGSSTISWLILLLPLFGVVFIGMGKFNSRGFRHVQHLKRYNRLY
jgi:hypothetical protein